MSAILNKDRIGFLKNIMFSFIDEAWRLNSASLALSLSNRPCFKVQLTHKEQIPNLEAEAAGCRLHHEVEFGMLSSRPHPIASLRMQMHTHEHGFVNLSCTLPYKNAMYLTSDNYLVPKSW